MGLKFFVAMVVVLFGAHGCDSGGGSGPDVVGEGRFTLEAWADNWFALYVGDRKVAEDSVSISTERSFNAERVAFDADYPLVLNLIINDYKADDSGLEYIGTDKQQMGDAGFIMQITDSDTGEVVAVSSSAMKCQVIHKAPLNKDCEKSADPATECVSEISDEPADWKSADHDVSGWETASEYTAAQVGTKDGYDEIAWNAAAKLIWTSDLESDNTVLCKLTVAAP